MLLSAEERLTSSELATPAAAFNWLMLAPIAPRWFATSAIAEVILPRAVVAEAALVSTAEERSTPAPPPVAVPMLAFVRAPVVAAIVVVPPAVPSLTTKFVAVAENTLLLLKFVVLPMFPISLTMLWYSVSAAVDSS